MKRTALVLGSTFVACLGVEIGVRLLGVAPDIAHLDIDKPYGAFMVADNPILKYVPRPGRGDINRFGFRDREYAFEKPQGVFRIVVIGDSIAFGFCNDNLPAIPIERVFSKVLERGLNDAAGLGSRKFEVINLGVSGYDSRQEVEFLKFKGLALAPDLVLVAYCLNDPEEGSAEGHALMQRGWNRIVSTSAFRYSALVRFLWQRLPWLFGGSQADRPRDNRAELAFDELKSLAETHHFSVATAVFPWLIDFKQYERSRWPVEHEYVARVSSERGFPLLDLLDPYESASGGDFRTLQRPCRGPHPNENGHAIAAKAIQEFLIRSRLLPGS